MNWPQFATSRASFRICPSPPINRTAHLFSQSFFEDSCNFLRSLLLKKMYTQQNTSFVQFGGTGIHVFQKRDPNIVEAGFLIFKCICGKEVILKAEKSTTRMINGIGRWNHQIAVSDNIPHDMIRDSMYNNIACLIFDQSAWERCKAENWVLPLFEILTAQTKFPHTLSTTSAR